MSNLEEGGLNGERNIPRDDNSLNPPLINCKQRLTQEEIAPIVISLYVKEAI